MTSIKLSIKAGDYDIDTKLREFYTIHETFFNKRNINSKDDFVYVMKWNILKTINSNVNIIFSLGFSVDYINKQISGYVYESDEVNDVQFVNNFNSNKEGAAILYALNVDVSEVKNDVAFNEISLFAKYLSSIGAWPADTHEQEVVESGKTVFVSSKDRYIALFRSSTVQSIHYLLIKTSYFDIADNETLFALSNSNNSSKLLNCIRQYAPKFFKRFITTRKTLNISELWSTTFNDCISTERGMSYYNNCYRIDWEGQCVLPIVDIENRTLFVLSDADNFWSIKDMMEPSKEKQQKLISSMATNSKTLNLSRSFDDLGIFELPKRGIKPDFTEMLTKKENFNSNNNNNNNNDSDDDNDDYDYDNNNNNNNNNNNDIHVNNNNNNNDDDENNGNDKEDKIEAIQPYQEIVNHSGAVWRDKEITPTIADIMLYEKNLPTVSLKDDILNDFIPKFFVQAAFLLNCVHNPPSYVFDVSAIQLLNIHFLFNSRQLVCPHDNKQLFILCVDELFSHSHTLSSIQQSDDLKYFTFDIHTLRSVH